VAIAALVIWLLTAAAGMTLLSRGSRARRDAAAAVTRSAPARPAPVPVPVPGAGRGPDGEMPDIPQVKVHATPGEHPLLQFSHPALGIIGLACWFAFVFTHDHVFAWIAIGVLAVTIGAGLSWLTVQRRDARPHADGNPGPSVPVHRIVLHGLAAATTCGLAIAAILVAGHG